MKLITTIVRPERLPEVKAALFRAGITGITLSRVSGHGGEHERFEQYRGTAIVMEFHEKVKIEMVCSEPFVEPCVQAILASARTGEVGDGKIFVQPIERVIRSYRGQRRCGPTRGHQRSRYRTCRLTQATLSSGDTGWVLVSSALVLSMTVGQYESF